ncbi:MAG: hypothetical protein QXO70_03510 [Candidatus Pacearchaeota archaeon]
MGAALGLHSGITPAQKIVGAGLGTLAGLALPTFYTKYLSKNPFGSYDNMFLPATLGVGGFTAQLLKNLRQTGKIGLVRPLVTGGLLAGTGLGINMLSKYISDKINKDIGQTNVDTDKKIFDIIQTNRDKKKEWEKTLVRSVYNKNKKELAMEKELLKEELKDKIKENYIKNIVIGAGIGTGVGGLTGYFAGKDIGSTLLGAGLGGLGGSALGYLSIPKVSNLNSIITYFLFKKAAEEEVPPVVLKKLKNKYDEMVTAAGETAGAPIQKENE